MEITGLLLAKTKKERRKSVTPFDKFKPDDPGTLTFDSKSVSAQHPPTFHFSKVK